MRFVSSCIVFACLAVSLSATAADAFTGRYLGTGRACYGTLTVTPKMLSWQTPFSRCRAKSYQTVERDSGRTTLRLKPNLPGCRYQIVSLTHNVAEGPDQGWNVTGYPNEASYRAHKANGFATVQAETLSCYLIRDTNSSGPSDW